MAKYYSPDGVPILNGTNYGVWKNLFRPYLCSRDNRAWIYVEKEWSHPLKKSDGVDQVTEIKPKEEWSCDEHKQAILNSIALSVIRSALDSNEVKRISNCTTAYEAWHILQAAHEGDSVHVSEGSEGDCSSQIARTAPAKPTESEDADLSSNEDSEDYQDLYTQMYNRWVDCDQTNKELEEKMADLVKQNELLIVQLKEARDEARVSQSKLEHLDEQYQACKQNCAEAEEKRAAAEKTLMKFGSSSDKLKELISSGKRPADKTGLGYEDCCSVNSLEDRSISGEDAAGLSEEAVKVAAKKPNHVSSRRTDSRRSKAAETVFVKGSTSHNPEPDDAKPKHGAAKQDRDAAKQGPARARQRPHSNARGTRQRSRPRVKFDLDERPPVPVRDARDRWRWIRQQRDQKFADQRPVYHEVPNPQYSPPKPKVVCHYCKRPGHIRPRCYKLLHDLRTNAANEYHSREFAKYGRCRDTAKRHPRTRGRSRGPRYMRCYMATLDCKAAKKDNSWYLDSGASRHMTGDREILVDFKSYDGGSVTFGDGKKARVMGKGTLKMEGMPSLKNVYYVQDLKSNLLSISQLCDTGLTVNFTKSGCSVVDDKEDEVLVCARTFNNCYKVSSSMVCNFTSIAPIESWHEKLGHIHFRGMQRLVRNDGLRTRSANKNYREMIANAACYVFTEKQFGDLFIKALDSQRFEALRLAVGICRA